MSTKTKTKPGFLAGLKAAVGANAPPDWDAKVAIAQRALDVAKQAHGRAAYEAQVELPGSSEALLRAIEALQGARTRLETVTAARDEWDRLEGDRSRAARAADIAKQDKASQAVFDRQAASAARGEGVVSAYLDWYAETLALSGECQAQFASNGRLRSDLAFSSVNDLVGREIARQAVVKFGDGKPLPPGANVIAAQTSDPREWPSLADHFAGLAKAVLG